MFEDITLIYVSSSLQYLAVHSATYLILTRRYSKQCVSTFSSRSTLFNETRQHIESNHHDQYCGQCDAIFLTKEDNIRHHTTVHETATKQDCVKDIQTEATIGLVRTPDLIAFS